MENCTYTFGQETPLWESGKKWPSGQRQPPKAMVLLWKKTAALLGNEGSGETLP